MTKLEKQTSSEHRRSAESIRALAILGSKGNRAAIFPTAVSSQFDEVWRFSVLTTRLTILSQLSSSRAFWIASGLGGSMKSNDWRFFTLAFNNFQIDIQRSIFLSFFNTI